MSDDIKPVKLNENNWNTWKFNIKMYLMGKDLWGLADGSEALNDDATAKEREAFKRRDNKAQSMISLSIETHLQIYVRPAKSAAEAWKFLTDRFEEKTLSKICYYRKLLYKMELKGGQSMEVYVNNMKTIAEHLDNLDDPVAEKDLVYLLITSLPPDYSSLITALETLKKEELTWTYVRDRVISEYARKKSFENKKTSQDALLTSQGGGNRNKQFSGHNNNNDGSDNKQSNQFNRKDQAPGQGKGRIKIRFSHS